MNHCDDESQYHGWMKANCCESCEKIQKKECKGDKTDEFTISEISSDVCMDMKKSGYCSPDNNSHYDWMMDNCCATCKLKDTPTPHPTAGPGESTVECEDDWDYCEELPRSICLDRNTAVHCRKTCDMCRSITDPDWCNHNEVVVGGNKYIAEGTQWTKGRHIEDAAVRLAPKNNSLACDEFDGRFFQGMIAVVDRGVCFFSKKVAHVQKAGAVALIVVDYRGFNDDEKPLRMADRSGYDTPHIPAVAITFNAGSAVKELVKKKKKVLGTLLCPECQDESFICEQKVGKFPEMCEQQFMHSTCALTCGFCKPDATGLRPPPVAGATYSPSRSPSLPPTGDSLSPSFTPTYSPTVVPTVSPSIMPTASPTNGQITSIEDFSEWCHENAQTKQSCKENSCGKWHQVLKACVTTVEFANRLKCKNFKDANVCTMVGCTATTVKKKGKRKLKCKGKMFKKKSG